MLEDITKATNVSAARLNFHKIETGAAGIIAHIAIYESAAAGSGIAGIEPMTSKDVALDLVAQVTTDV